MRHQLDDSVFQTNWVINSVQLTMQANGFKLVLSESEYDIVLHEAGYNVYGLTVPIVAANVIVSAKGILAQLRLRRVLGERNLQEDSDAKGVNTMLDIGVIGVEPANTVD